MPSIRRFAALSIAAAAALFSFPAPSSALNLVHGSWTSARSYVNRVAYPKAFKAIEKETKGQVKWKLVPGGSLAGPKDSFQATSDGLIQGALGISTYVPNLVPSLNTIYSNIVFDADVVAASGAAMETFYFECPSCLAEFKKINIAPLSGWTSSPYYLACRSPVRSLDDMKGKRVRATGGYSELWRTAGAVPVAATLPEAVTLLQRGGLDCENGINAWLRIFGYADFAKNVTDHPLGLTGPAIGWMINRDAWKKLTRDQKILHLKQAANISASVAIGQFVVEEAAALKGVQKSKGVKVLKADASSFDKVTAAYDKEQRDRIIENAKRFGVSDPGAIVDAYRKNITKWKTLTKDIGTDIDKYSALMWTHIYSKVDPDKL